MLATESGTAGLSARPTPRRLGAAAAAERSAHAAFVCATEPMKIAVSAGGTADQQLEAMARGFADLVASEWGRALSLLEVTAIPPATANRVRRHRRLLATLARNVLDSGRTSGEFAVTRLDEEVRRWIRLADALPRWLLRLPEQERRVLARWVFTSLANAYRAAADAARRVRANDDSAPHASAATEPRTGLRRR